jgi:HlyD family secretion protein
MDQPINAQTLRRRQRIRLATALAVLAGVCAAALGINRLAGPSAAAADLMLAAVRRGDIANTISASGVVIPEHEELVSSPIQTRVAHVHARLGDQVKAGALLLELDDHALRLAVDSAQEQLAQQENRLRTLTAEMEQKRKQLASAIELLELDLRSARDRWDRYQILRKSGAVKGEDLLTAELNVQRTTIQLRQQRDLVEDNRRGSEAAIEGARLQGSILRKQLDRARQLLEQAQVRAPFAGMVTSIMSEEGASVSTGQLVAKVSALDQFRIEAQLSDFHSSSLNPGQAVRVDVGGERLAGHIDTILPEIQNGAIKLLVKLDQPNHPRLRNKMRVEANIVTDQKSGVLLVDTGPAFNGKGSQAAFVLRDGVAHKVNLVLGSGDGKAIEVVAGAKLGERIVISDIKPYKEYDSFRISQ